MLERLEASLRDILAVGDRTLPVELIAEALSAAAELSLKLGNAARAETHFARLEDWAQQHRLKQWQRRARRGLRQAVRSTLRPAVARLPRGRSSGG